MPPRGHARLYNATPGCCSRKRARQGTVTNGIGHAIQDSWEDEAPDFDRERDDADGQARRHHRVPAFEGNQCDRLVAIPLYAGDGMGGGAYPSLERCRRRQCGEADEDEAGRAATQRSRSLSGHQTHNFNARDKATASPRAQHVVEGSRHQP